MSERRPNAGARSTWITMRRNAERGHDSDDRDSGSDDEPVQARTGAARMARLGHYPLPFFVPAYDRDGPMPDGSRPPGEGGNGDVAIYASDHEDEGEDSVLGMPLTIGILDATAGAEMHSDDSGRDEGGPGADQHFSGHGNFMSALESPQAPAAVPGGSGAGHGSTAGRRARGKDKAPRSPFIPKYLENTAYGDLFHRSQPGRQQQRQQQQTQQQQGSAGTSGASDGSPATGLDGCPAASDVAPDIFFRTLVQDSWPHYCTPAPTMPSLDGLELGYNLGIGSQTHAVLAEGPGEPQSQGGSGGNRPPWRADQGQSGTSPGHPRRATDQARRGCWVRHGRAAHARRLPSRWLLRGTSNLEIEPDHVTVRYTGPGKRDADAAMLLANVCIPPGTGVYYFEVHVVSRGQCGYIGIGLSRAGLSSRRLPGWDHGSWGYHGDDGHGFGGTGHGAKFGPQYSTGDTVGCGMDFMRRRIFFTLNGLFLGYAFDALSSPKDLYPCVGMRTPAEHVTANFGREPFVFDIDGYVASAREEALRQVHAAPVTGLLPPRPTSPADEARSAQDISTEDDGAMRMDTLLAQRESRLGLQPHSASVSEADAMLILVLHHLVQSECFGTARALIENAIVQRSKADPADWADQPGVAAVLAQLTKQSERRETRQRICGRIRDGDIDAALGLLQSAYPAVLDDETLVFQLRCRQFIELVRAASGQRIVDSVPSDDDVMDVDDASQPPALMSLAAITSAPNASRRTRFGQLGAVDAMEPARLVRVLLDYGRQLQADYGASPNAIVREGLVHAFSLLAYADPAQSPVAALLDPAARGPLARLVEMAIVATEKAPCTSALERLCRQTATLLSELSDRRSGAAALISIERDFLQEPNR
ncbi:hypothetical protein GGF46_004512 [Coemansia sp. RSA 552]|nr:hypothetical protein GGF46_004512 [Coemansia sp. RSA 552]